MTPEQLEAMRQAVIDRHLSGDTEGAQAAAAALAAHPDSGWTANVVPGQSDINSAKDFGIDIGDYLDKNKTQGPSKPANLNDIQGMADTQQPYQVAQNDAPALVDRVDDDATATPSAERSDEPALVDRSDEEGTAADKHNFLGGGLMDYSEAALQPFASDVSFGLVPKAQNALAAAMYGPKGTFDSWDNFSKVYDAANEANEERYAQLKAAHPGMNALGNVAGFLEGGRMLGDAIPTALRPAEGSSAFSLPNLGKNFTVGAGVGSEDSLVDGIGKEQSTGQRIENAVLSAGIGGVTSAVAGPLLSKGVEFAKERLPGVGNTLSAGWRKAAQSLGITKAELPGLQAHLDAQRAAGVTPTLASAMNAKQTGQLAKLANKNPDLATLLNEGKTAAANASPDEMAASVQRHIVAPTAATADPTTGRVNPLLHGVAPDALEPGTIKQAIKSNTTAAMDAIRTRQVPLPDELLQSPEVADATRGYSGRQLRARIAEVSDPANATSGHLTVNEVNQLRENLNGLSQRPGDAHAVARQDLMNETRAAVPEYNQIMQDYGNADKYRLGFKLGNQGRTMGSSDHAPTMAAVGTSHGVAGHQAGILTNLRTQAAKGVDSAVDVATEASRVGATQRALQAASPQGAQDIQNTGQNIAARAAALRAGTPAVNVPDEPNALGSVVRGTGAALTGMSHTAGHHYGRAVMEFLGSNTFSPEVQQSIGRGLMSADPAVQRQTLIQLQRAGASTEQIRNLAQKLGGMASSALVDKLNRNVPQ